MSKDLQNIIFEVLFSLFWACDKKCIARPRLRFFNSINITPVDNLLNQILSFPLPLPIRDPITFLVKGIWGNVLTHTRRDVLSVRRAALLKNNFNLNIFLLFINNGFVSTNPIWPKNKLLCKWTVLFNRRRLWRNLYLNFLGWSTINSKFE